MVITGAAIAGISALVSALAGGTSKIMNRFSNKQKEEQEGISGRHTNNWMDGASMGLSTLSDIGNLVSAAGNLKPTANQLYNQAVSGRLASRYSMNSAKTSKDDMFKTTY